MTVLLAAAIGALFGAGAYLLLKPELIRVAIGILLISHAANLALMSAGRRRGNAAIEPLEEPVTDAVVQAMTITAIVIGFAVTALLLAIIYRVHRSHATTDLDELARAEIERSREDGEEPAP